jgi:signal peptidase I
MAKHRAARKKMPWWQETFLLLAVALAASILVKAFFVQMFFVPSASMHPTLVEDDRILVEKISTWDGEPDRGDVVVFKDPGGWLDTTPEPTGFQEVLSLLGLYPEGGHLVKRVIGVGGDHVVCCDRRGRITVNGDPLRERDYLPRGTAPSMKQFDVRVPDDAVWVMGDNRSNSEDSRYHQDMPGGGTVPAEDVVGRVWAIVWPLDRAQILHRPDTFETIPPPPSR